MARHMEEYWYVLSFNYIDSKYKMQSYLRDRVCSEKLFHVKLNVFVIFKSNSCSQMIL